MPENNVTLLVGTKKGAFKIRGGENREGWKISKPEFYGFAINHIVQDPRNEDHVLLCGRTGHLGPTVHHSYDRGETWAEAETPPAFPKVEAAEGEKKGRSVKHAFWLTPSNANEPDVWYLGASPLGLFRSDDGGKNWKGVDGFNQSDWIAKLDGGGVPDVDQVVHSVMVDPEDSNHLYIGISSGGVFESLDRGENWTPLNKGMAADFIPEPDPEYGHDPHCMVISPAMPNRIYQQNHCGIYRIDRPDNTWTRIGDNMPKEIGDVGFCIQPHPRDPDTAWVFPMDASDVWPRVCKDGHAAVYKTTDAGASWHRKDMGLPQHNAWLQVKRQCMTADECADVGVYFGTSSGEVYVSHDEGESWMRVAEHLPPILSVEVAKAV